MPYKDPELQRTYQREWMATRRANFFASKSCQRERSEGPCGSTEKLELDHRDPASKDPSLRKVNSRGAAIWSWSEPRREAELAKCQVLCRPCHLEKGREAGELGHLGERNGQARLTTKDAQAILDSTKVADLLADEFKICKSQVYAIKRGAAWGHLQSSPPPAIA